MRYFIAALALVYCSIAAHAQGNYEVQVYGSDLVTPRATMVELHSNFTLAGTKTAMAECCRPTMPNMRRWRSRMASTNGSRPASISSPAFKPMEVGCGWARTSGRASPFPKNTIFRWGISISNEIGYQRPIFSGDTWTWEIRPIIDKKRGNGIGRSIRRSISRSMGRKPTGASNFTQLQIQL